MSTPRENETWSPWIGVQIAIACLVIAHCCGFLFDHRNHHQASRRSCCKNNLKQLAIALHNYHDVHDTFPPAYVADDRGQFEHSWRVFALPYIEEAPLYNRYQFDEPWDGPHNSQLADITLSAYQCPTDHAAPNTQETWTSYVAVVGPHTIWPGSESIPISEITDGTSNTLLVAECHNTGIHWMAPRDLNVDQMAPGINSAGGQGISSPHEGGAQVALADGSVRFVSENIDPKVVRRLIERDDGEEVGEF